MTTSEPRAGRSWPTFEGGKTLRAGAFGVGVIGLGLTAARAFMGEGGAKVALHSYLTAYAYWAGIAIASLILLAIWAAAKAKWVVAIRRPVEVFSMTLPLFAVLFLPILLGMRLIYPWAGTPEQIAALSPTDQHLIHHRSHWLNPHTFTVRAILYFAIWIFFSRVVVGASLKQDKTGEPHLTQRIWTWGAASIPFICISMAFAAFDWLMSIETQWFSSMWGVYYFAGSFVSLFSVLLLVLRSLEKDPSYKGTIRVTHWLSTGQFLLAFTAFWGYIAFDQYMLTWVANIPDAIPFLVRRQAGEWLWVSCSLAIGHFFIPFFLLLSRPRKLDPNRIALVALWILLMHYVDMYWIVVPQLGPSAIPDWSTLAAFVGVGGLAIGFALMRFAGLYAVPVKDPFLVHSLKYKTVTAGTGYLTDTEGAH